MRERERERETEREIKQERETERQKEREREREREKNHLRIDRINRHLDQTMHNITQWEKRDQRLQ